MRSDFTMVFFPIIFLAIVQGITEFIPVSSSAHLILSPILLGWEDQGLAMDIAAHLGSLAAVLIYFRTETTKLFFGSIDVLRWRASGDRSLVLYLAFGTLPLILMGLILSLSGLIQYFRDPIVIAIASIGFGVLLFYADRKRVTVEGLPDNWKNVIIIGLAQALATIPGTSRSGITITAARWLGYDREYAARFSMLLAIPAIMASSAYLAIDFIKEGANFEYIHILIMGVMSFIAAYITIIIFLRFTKKMSFTPFVIYRILLGVLILFLVV